MKQIGIATIATLANLLKFLKKSISSLILSLLPPGATNEPEEVDWLLSEFSICWPGESVVTLASVVVLGEIIISVH